MAIVKITELNDVVKLARKRIQDHTRLLQTYENRPISWRIGDWPSYREKNQAVNILKGRIASYEELLNALGNNAVSPKPEVLKPQSQLQRSKP